MYMGLFSDGFKELKKASEPLYKAPKSIQECRVKMGMTQEKLAETLITKKHSRYLPAAVHAGKSQRLWLQACLSLTEGISAKKISSTWTSVVMIL